MSKSHFNEDFFSPVCEETLDTGSNDDSTYLSSSLNFDMTGSFKKSPRNESDLDNIKSIKETNELKQDSDSLNFGLKEHGSSDLSTPTSSRNSVKLKRTSKPKATHFNEPKIESERNLKETSSKNSVRHKKIHESESKETVDDSKTKELKVAQSSARNVEKRLSRPTSLSLSKDVSKNVTSKDMKKEKTKNQSSKNLYDISDKQKSFSKHSKKKTESNELPINKLSSHFKDPCAKSIVPSNRTSYDSSIKETGVMNQVAENSKFSIPSQFEISVEKMVHDHISFECDKVRQDVIAQQISFYRELNKLKGEMEEQHSEMTERMFKIIEGLMEFNFALKAKSHLK